MKNTIFAALLIHLTCSLFPTIGLSENCPPKPQKQKLLFTELRYFPNVKEPVNVTGSLQLLDNNNFTWESDGEYASKIEKNGDQNTFYRKEDGEWVRTETNEFLDLFFEINTLLNGGGAAKSKLKKTCSFKEDMSWTLLLSPREKDSEISEIKIEGKENPERFSLSMKNGFRSLVSYH